MTSLRYFTLTILLGIGCAPATPSLTPVGVAAFRGTQAIKALDLLRDAAIDANAMTPPLLSTDTTRRVVLYHKSSITIIHSAPADWRPTVLAGLAELRDALPDAERDQLGPYVTLVRDLLQEAP